MADFLLILLIGGIWTLVSVIVIKGRHEGCSSEAFYLVGNIVSVFFCLFSFLFPGIDMDDLSQPGKAEVLICFAAASLLNGIGQAVTMYNLKAGGRTLAVAIPQMAFLFPFLGGMLFWNEPVSSVRICGVLVIALAVLATTLGRVQPQGNGGVWDLSRLYLALLAAGLLGCSQLIVVMAGYCWPEGMLSNMTRTFFYMLSAVAFFGGMFFRKAQKNWRVLKKSLKWGAVWGIVATFSNLLLFFCVERFTQNNQSGIVYATGGAVLMVGIACYTRIVLKEKLAVAQYIGLVGMIAGLLMARLGA